MDKTTPWYVRVLKLQPALIRAALVAVLAVVAQVVGHEVVEDATIDSAIDIFTAVSPVIAGWVIRSAVTPNAKVTAYQPDPVQLPNLVVAGEAAISETGALLKPEEPYLGEHVFGGHPDENDDVPYAPDAQKLEPLGTGALNQYADPDSRPLSDADLTADAGDLGWQSDVPVIDAEPMKEDSL